MLKATTYGGADRDAGTSVEARRIEVSFATACAITLLTVFSSWDSLDTHAFSSDNVLNDTYAHSIVAQDDNHVISQPSCNRGCEPPTDMISI